jgi:hypothetical protein
MPMFPSHHSMLVGQKRKFFEVILFHPTRRRFRLVGLLIGVVPKQDLYI